MAGWKLVVMVVLVIVTVIDVGHCEHFRGGTMTWKATNDGRVKVSYSLAWKADTLEGHHNCTFERVAANALVEGNDGGLRFMYPGVPNDRIIYSLPYRCTERLEAADYPGSLDRSWVMGENSMILSPPADGRMQFNLVYPSCCWVSTLQNYGSPRNWDMVMSVDLDARADTHAINTPPITKFIPVQRISKGCNTVVMNIPTYDADGDDVSCRWVDEFQGECRDNCRAATVWNRSIFTIRNRGGTCKLVLRPRRAETGWYAIALMIEDSSNGVIHSKIPVQFMMEFTDETSCSLPVVVRPAADACWNIPVDEAFSFNITARTTGDSQLESIATTNVVGMQKSPLRQVPGSETDFYVTITWTPTQDDLGVHPFCFQPQDTNGLQGSQKCVEISVKLEEDRAPTPDSFFSKPSANRTIFVNDTTFEIIFDGVVARPNQESEIRILFTRNRSVVYSVKVEPSPTDGLLFSYNAILFSIPVGVLQNYATYTLDLPEGLARGYGSCAPWSRAASWNFSTGNSGSPAYPKPPTKRPFLGDPQCFGTFMQIYIPKTMVPYEDPSLIRLNEPTCLGSEHNSSHFVIGTQYQYCATQIRTVQSSRKSIISNTVHIPSMVINDHYRHATRRNATEINMVCEMANDLITYAEFEPDVPTVVFNRTSFGEFNFSLRMFPDDSYTSSARYADYPVEVSLSQRLYFEAKALIDSSLPMRIFLKACEATPSPNPVDLLYYRFIREDCALDNTVTFESRSRLKTRFSIEAFAFLGHFQSDSIFVHCNIQVRDDDGLDTECPTADNEASRRRRHANTASLSSARFNTEGPIKFVEKDMNVELTVVGQ